MRSRDGGSSIIEGDGVDGQDFVVAPAVDAFSWRVNPECPGPGLVTCMIARLRI
jgi:hypothetical protein